jgi:hypothetical protein
MELIAIAPYIRSHPTHQSSCSIHHHPKHKKQYHCHDAIDVMPSCVPKNPARNGRNNQQPRNCSSMSSLPVPDLLINRGIRLRHRIDIDGVKTCQQEVAEREENNDDGKHRQRPPENVMVPFPDPEAALARGTRAPPTVAMPNYASPCHRQNRIRPYDPPSGVSFSFFVMITTSGNIIAATAARSSRRKATQRSALPEG